MFHDIPIAHNSRALFKCVPYVPPGGCIGVAVQAGERKGLAKFSVTVLGHDGWDGESGLVFEVPSCADRGGAWLEKNCCQLDFRGDGANEKGGGRVPLSITITALPSGCCSAFSRPSGCDGVGFSNLTSFTGYTVGGGRPSLGPLMEGRGS